MKRIVIKAQNFSDIEKVQEVARKDVLKRYQLDRWDNYARGSFAIIGEDALQMFREKYGCILNNYREPLKTDGKTRAKLVPYIEIDYYFDARTNNGGFSRDLNHTEIKYLVEFDGVTMYDISFSYEKGARPLYLFNDGTDFNKHLPNGWEEEHPRPQNVGTLTDKKAAAWAEWLQAKKAAAETEKARQEGKIAAFLAKVRAMDLTGCKEHRFSDHDGFIIRNGLRYSYSISDRGHIHEQIKVDYFFNVPILEAFEKMTKGQF